MAMYLLYLLYIFTTEEDDFRYPFEMQFCQVLNCSVSRVLSGWDPSLWLNPVLTPLSLLLELGKVCQLSNMFLYIHSKVHTYKIKPMIPREKCPFKLGKAAIKKWWNLVLEVSREVQKISYIISVRKHESWMIWVSLYSLTLSCVAVSRCR